MLMVKKHKLGFTIMLYTKTQLHLRAFINRWTACSLCGTDTKACGRHYRNVSFNRCANLQTDLSLHTCNKTGFLRTQPTLFLFNCMLYAFLLSSEIYFRAHAQTHTCTHTQHSKSSENQLFQ